MVSYNHCKTRNENIFSISLSNTLIFPYAAHKFVEFDISVHYIQNYYDLISDSTNWSSSRLPN